MIFEGLLIGVFIGKLRGGSLRNLGRYVMRLSLLLVGSLLVNLGTSILISVGYEKAIENRMLLYIASYLMLFAFLFSNLGKKTLWLVLIGAILNFTAIVLNGGSMPVDLNMLSLIGSENLLESIQLGEMVNYMDILSAKGFTSYLGKNIMTPAWYPLKQVFSIGDGLIAIGILLFTQNTMNHKKHHGNLVKFNQNGKIRL